jgi:hypothetical protein
MNNVKLTEAEVRQLVDLMNKVTFPAPLPVFEAWCRVFGAACAELAVVRQGELGPELFLVYREDKFFKGWHIPGCIHMPHQEFGLTLKRVLDNEIKMDTEIPIFFDWFERPYGHQNGHSARGHEFSFVYTAYLKGESRENENEKFFPFHKLPGDIMHHQIPIVDKLAKYFSSDEAKQ